MSDILLENYLASQFTFGFELEGVFHFDEDVKHSSRNSVIKHTIGQAFNIPDEEIEIKGDGSLEISDSDNYKYSTTFEWASPVFQFTPSELHRVITGLDTLFKNKRITTNKTCGFHTHISFPDITDKDAAWIIIKLSEDEEMRKIISKFKNINFTHEQWASDKFLEQINYFATNGHWGRIKDILNTEKYRSIRIHPQGTMEWRGPRNFMNRYYKARVYAFFKLLYQFINFMSKSLASKEAYGTSKENIFKMIYPGKSEDESIIINFKEFERNKDKADSLMNSAKHFANTMNVKGFIRLYNSNKKIAQKMLKLLASEYDENYNKFIYEVFKHFESEGNHDEMFEVMEIVRDWGSVLKTFKYNSLQENIELACACVNYLPTEYIRTTLFTYINRFFDTADFDWGRDYAELLRQSYSWIEEKDNYEIFVKTVKKWLSEYPRLLLNIAPYIQEMKFIDMSSILDYMMEYTRMAIKDYNNYSYDNKIRDNTSEEEITKIVNNISNLQVEYVINMIKAAEKNPIFGSYFNNMMNEQIVNNNIPNPIYKVIKVLYKEHK